jgi:hypothetical protein
MQREASRRMSEDSELLECVTIRHLQLVRKGDSDDMQSLVLPSPLLVSPLLSLRLFRNSDRDRNCVVTEILFLYHHFPIRPRESIRECFTSFV